MRLKGQAGAAHRPGFRIVESIAHAYLITNVTVVPAMVVQPQGAAEVAMQPEERMT